MSKWLKRFDCQLEVTPPIDDDQLLQIPAKRGVFCMLTADDKPIVLLTGANIRSRLRNRLRNPDQQERRKVPNLHEITRKVCWRLTFSHFETDLAYLQLARQIWPDSYSSLLGWKPAWFVYVNVEDEYPNFARSRDVLRQPGEYLGPFESGKSADKFIDVTEDVFDLCRDYQCLKKYPNGSLCTYAQMNKCLKICDGTISMDAYRDVLRQASEFALGQRRGFREKLQSRMKEAADNFEFEFAGRMKSKIERLGEFEKFPFANIEPIDRFQFILIQSGPSFHQARAFFVNKGFIALGKDLDYPLKPKQIGRTIRDMAGHVDKLYEKSEVDRFVIGLVSSYLFSSQQRKGIMIRWQDSLSEQYLAKRIEKAVKILHLREPKKRTSKKSKPKKSSAETKTR